MKLDLADNRILACYLHGSRVYGTANAQSDYDYIVVVDDNVYETDQRCYDNEDYNFITRSQWDQMALNNDCDFMECMFLPATIRMKEAYIPSFTLNKTLIRQNFSAKASNSWVKCKKKLTVEQDYAPYIGKKSLWHSLRLLDFGIQLLTYGKIVNYGSMNAYYDPIINAPTNDWIWFKNTYQPLYNRLKSTFRAFDHD